MELDAVRHLLSLWIARLQLASVLAEALSAMTALTVAGSVTPSRHLLSLLVGRLQLASMLAEASRP